MGPVALIWWCHLTWLMATWLADLAEYFGFPLTKFDLRVLSFWTKFWCQQYAGKFTKMDKNACIEGKQMWQGAMGPQCHVSWCHLAPPNGPTPLATSLIHGRASTLLLQCWSMSVWSKGGGWAALDRLVHIIHLEGPNWSPNHLSDQSNCHRSMQPPSRSHPSPLDGKAVQGTVGQRPPRSVDTSLPLHHLIFTYKYPYALYTL
jgi:hypothetical protein